MSDELSVEWEKGHTPEDLAKSVRRYGDQLIDRIAAAAEDAAVYGEGMMRLNRPWRDITGNARRGLRTQTVRTDDEIVIYFIHSVEYGVQLELGHGGRYAIIMPTLNDTIPRLRDALRRGAG